MGKITKAKQKIKDRRFLICIQKTKELKKSFFSVIYTIFSVLRIEKVTWLNKQPPAVFLIAGSLFTLSTHSFLLFA